MSEGRKIEDAEHALAFILAGDARVTFVSSKTEARFTYRVEQAEDRETGKPVDGLWFVKLLVNPDNERGYQYLGTIRRNPSGCRYGHGAKSKIGQQSPGAMAFAWTFQAIASGRVPATAEVWHEGRCGRCGRALTVPSSIESGIGPECSRKMMAA
jgi:hypothetical protein